MRQFLAALLYSIVPVELQTAPVVPAVDFDFRPGDRVCLVGNGLAEEMQHDGWFETLLQVQLSGRQVSLRNLGFAGDEVSMEWRTEGFGSRDEHLTRCRANVVLAFFGYNESFRGDAGLEPFRSDLAVFVEHVRSTRYSGDGAAGPTRLVLFSSIPHEDLENPLLPDGREHNERLARYHRVMQEVAGEKKVPFVDLFTPMQQAYAHHAKPLTVDGIHLKPEGNRVLAKILVSALFGRIKLASEPEPLRAEIRAKDALWFARYQTTDGYNVYGGRSSLAYTDGISNYDVLQRELAILDGMVEQRDRRIWALASHRDTDTLESPNPSELPPKIRVKTNIPGSRPDGTHDFLDGEAAIGRMTPAPGMKVELFADERRFPELAKPVQMAWDTRGRLWVAAWPGYPHWEPGLPMSDKLLILEDADRDGRADSCKTFAGGLRDPTGFEFWNGGVLVAQAPDLILLKDTDGDDVADSSERLLRNLSSADTHHTANSFVLGPDGALYFQEGTFHRTQIETIYGPQRNRDACVWRFEPRTWRVDRHVAYNFANPHGHVFDRFGQEFVTDGTGNDNYYAVPFSGRVDHPDKHAPYFTFFKQRSRPCAATEILSSRHFPPENQGNLLICNVIGFQGIFQYRFVEDGSGFGAEEVEPLVFSSDAAFRPSDIEVGPDGAVWFLDWCTPVIGHMQHHLRDPNRDHEHGRVYRITCEGRPLLEPKPIAGRPIPELLSLLKEPEDRVRYRARIELSGRDTREVVAAARAWEAGVDPSDPEVEHHRLEALWLQQQHATLDEGLLDRLLHSRDARVRAAAARVLRFERRSARDPIARLRELARDPHPRVRLEAVVAASFFGDGGTPEDARTGTQAALVALEALRSPTDRFLDYALKETMRTLAPHWRAALVAGELPLTENPAAVAYLVDRVSDRELDLLPRTESVLAALLVRHGTSAKQRQDAASELAANRRTSVAAEVVHAMREVDRSSGEHARHVQHALGSLLLEVVHEQNRDTLRELARDARLPETGAFALAACILVDGSVEPSWRESAVSAAGLRAFLGGLEHVGDGLAVTAHPQVRALMFERSIEVGSGETAPTRRGWLVSYYPVRLRTAAREGFERLEPQSTRIVESVGVDVPGVEKTDAFALRFRARLRVERAGSYRFQLASDDGSRLYVDGRLVVDNDLDHVLEEVTGECELEAGVHSLELGYFDQAGAQALQLRWSGPGFASQPLPVELVEPASDDGVRRSAIRAMAALPGHEVEKIEDALRLMREGAFVSEALGLLESMPVEAWNPGRTASVVDAITTFARSTHPEERTGTDVAAALELGRRLATTLPEAQARGPLDELARLGGTTILIRTVPHQMLYDRRAFTVAAGRPVALVFQNNDLMPHNLVVTEPGALEAVGTAAEAMATNPGAQERSFIPDLPAVLFRIPLLLPGESKTLRFVAPSTPGDHPYVCTFPGHWRVMNGVMHVVASPEQAATAEAEAVAALASPPPESTTSAAPPEPTRAFVRMWTLEDLKPALVPGWGIARSLERGRATFNRAGCAQCHSFRGEGAPSAPDLGAVTEKYRDAELLKQILEPSAAILEGYESWFFLLKDGSDVLGRVVKEDEQAWHVAPSLQKPDELVVVRKDSVESRKKSKLSAMPTGLLVTFTREEILDLLAFLQSKPGSASKE